MLLGCVFNTTFWVSECENFQIWQKLCYKFSSWFPGITADNTYTFHIIIITVAPGKSLESGRVAQRCFKKKSCFTVDVVFKTLRCLTTAPLLDFVLVTCLGPVYIYRMCVVLFLLSNNTPDTCVGNAEVCFSISIGTAYFCLNIPTNKTSVAYKFMYNNIKHGS